MNDEPTTECDRSMDAVFDVLASEPRRVLLEYLLEQNGPVGVAELADHVVEAIDWEDAGRLDPRTRAMVTLQHVHLPKMDDAGVIEYDPDRGTVVTTDLAREVQWCLDVVRGDDS